MKPLPSAVARSNGQSVRSGSRSTALRSASARPARRVAAPPHGQRRSAQNLLDVQAPAQVIGRDRVGPRRCREHDVESVAVSEPCLVEQPWHVERRPVGPVDPKAEVDQRVE